MIMEKVFEALKRIRQETCPATYNPDFDKEECLEVIEKALNEYKIKADKYDKINKVFNDSHIREIKKELAKYEPLCEETKCDECALAIGDGICLKAVFDTKWELQKEKQELEKYKKAGDVVKENIKFEFRGRLDNGKYLILMETADEYCALPVDTEEEYNLLKEVLE